MSHYVAIIEEPGPNHAIGVWFPDLPGCFAAGDTVDEALRNAPEAVALYAEALGRDGRSLAAPRALSELRKDFAFRAEAEGNMVALVSVPELAEPAE